MMGVEWLWMAVVVWKGRSGIVAELWGHRVEYRGEQGLGAGWVACTLLRKPICALEGLALLRLPRRAGRVCLGSCCSQ